MKDLVQILIMRQRLSQDVGFQRRIDDMIKQRGPRQTREFVHDLWIALPEDQRYA